MSVPEAAVIAASKALMADKMSNHSGDNAPQIMDACERVARKVLEAAAPALLAEWRQKSFGTSSKLGVSADVEVPIVRTGRPEVTVVATTHPYRTTK